MTSAKSNPAADPVAALETKIKQLEQEGVDPADAAVLIEECVRLAAECGQ